MSDQIFWYVTRSSALICWLAAALSMVVGLATSSRLLGRRPTIPWLVDLHRGFAGLSMVFLGVHMISLFLDEFVAFGIPQLLIPWLATVPGLTRSSIAYGVIAAWLMALVQVSSLFRDRLPSDVWRTVHLTSFASLGFGSLHAVETGSDMDNPIILGIGVAVLAAMFLVSMVRLVRLKTGTVRLEPTQAGSKDVGPNDPGHVGPGTEDIGINDLSPRRFDTRPPAPDRR